MPVFAMGIPHHRDAILTVIRVPFRFEHVITGLTSVKRVLVYMHVQEDSAHG